MKKQKIKKTLPMAQGGGKPSFFVGGWKQKK
jgi:hypothetical protein